MLRTFAEDGLAFDYPADWKLDREESEDGWAVTLQSPGAAFALVRVDRSMPPAPDVVNSALEALRADYPALEARSAVEPMAQEMAIGHDIEFFSFDLVNSCWTRCFYGPAGTVLLLCQAPDAEADHGEQLLAIGASMRVEE